jgi:hypothetical protein
LLVNPEDVFSSQNLQSSLQLLLNNVIRDRTL